MKHLRFIILLIIFFIFPLVISARDISILKIENNDLSNIEEKRKTLSISSSIIGIIVFTTSIIIINKSKDKDKNKYINDKNIKDIPDDLKPYIVGYLLDEKTLKRHASATILDLIERGIITYNVNQNNSIILSKNISDYSNISRAEEKLLDFVFENNNVCNLDELRSNHVANFKYLSYKNEVRNEALMEGLIKDEKRNKISSLIIALVIFISLVSLFVYIFNFNVIYIFIILLFIINLIALKRRKKKGIIPSSLCILSILFIIYSYINMFYNNESSYTYIGLLVIIPLIIIPMYIYLKEDIYTDKGILEFYKWSAFKEYLKGLCRSDDKYIAMDNKWQKYLAYAASIGYLNDVIKNVNMNTDMYIQLFLKLSTIINSIEDIISHNDNMIKNEKYKVK